MCFMYAVKWATEQKGATAKDKSSCPVILSPYAANIDEAILEEFDWEGFWWSSDGIVCQS